MSGKIDLSLFSSLRQKVPCFIGEGGQVNPEQSTVDKHLLHSILPCIYFKITLYFLQKHNKTAKGRFIGVWWFGFLYLLNYTRLNLSSHNAKSWTSKNFVWLFCCCLVAFVWCCLLDLFVLIFCFVFVYLEVFCGFMFDLFHMWYSNPKWARHTIESKKKKRGDK